jgi:hypothetical protein
MLITQIVTELSTVLVELATFVEEARAASASRTVIDESVLTDTNRAAHSAARIGQMIGYVFERNALGCRVIVDHKIHPDHVAILNDKCPRFIRWIA